MKTTITTIQLNLPLKMGSVNCYLYQSGDGFILIDTGPSQRRGMLEETLLNHGCQPGKLKLIILTHGDFDHAGNAAYLRAMYGSKIAMHRADTGMVEQGDMFSNRTKGNPIMSWISSRMFGFGKAEKFTPDIFLKEGDTFGDYGWSAQVLSIPGHSQGSIGILSSSGELFCGDLLDSLNDEGIPSINSIMDDLESANASVDKLRQHDIKIVYPGHGGSFPLDQLHNP